MKKRIGWILITVGLIAIIAALGLTAYNLWEDKRAENNAQAVLAQLQIPDEPTEAFSAEEITQRTMPAQTVDGHAYIGKLSVDKLALELPVMSEWSYPNLKIAPCRYVGNVYQNNLVIAAHNYNSHFGRLSSLAQGDTVAFTDMDGNRFTYRVVTVKALPPTAVEEMKAGEYDLTLFTCTYGGGERVTVCCRRI